MSEETADNLADRLDGPVRDAVAEEHGGMVTSWLAVVEYLDDEGHPALALVSDDDLTPSHGIGLADTIRESFMLSLRDWLTDP